MCIRQAVARVKVVLVAFLALTLLPSVASAVSCPPKAGDGHQLNGDVDGDGVNDYIFPGLTQKDAAGNTVEVYCLRPSGKHGWMFHSYYVDKATGKRTFIGGCFFPDGDNKRSKEKHKAGPNKGNWKLLDWDNWERSGTRDWHFEFDPATKKTTTKKTRRTATLHKIGDRWYILYRSEVIAEEVKDAVENPYHLLFEGASMMSACEGIDCGGISVANLEVSSHLDKLGQWQLSFVVPPFSGSGTEDDPFIGAPAQISAGDSLTLRGVSLTKAYVSGAAADPANGAWTVEAFSPDEVTFVATVDAELVPGLPVDGLFVETSYTGIGSVPWSASGDDIRYDGMIDGPGPIAPDPEPDPDPIPKTDAP